MISYIIHRAQSVLYVIICFNWSCVLGSFFLTSESSAYKMDKANTEILANEVSGQKNNI